MFFIIEELKAFVLDFLQGAVKVSATSLNEIKCNSIK